MQTQLISTVLLSEICSILEIICILVLSAKLVNLKPIMNPSTIALCLILNQLPTIIELVDIDTVMFMLFSIPTLLMITYVFFRQNIIQTIYLLIISYSLLVIEQTLLMVPFISLLHDKNSAPVMLTGNILTLISSIVIARFIPINTIYSFVLKKEALFRMILSNIFISTFLFIFLFKISVSNYIVVFSIIIVYITLTVLLNIALIRSNLKIDNQQSIINTYNEYLPVIEELIAQVRATQHQYHNHLSAINALIISCPDYESLKAELKKNIEHMSASSVNDEPIFLLEFNLKLMAGFLFNQYIIALSKGITLSFDIKNYIINTVIPEYQLVDAIGILIDNAIEACMEETNAAVSNVVLIEIDCIDNKFVFSAMNPGPVVTPELSDKLFKRGYSTKNNSSNNHGYGLNNLKIILDKYNGTIELGNEEILNRTYIYFKITV